MVVGVQRLFALCGGVALCNRNGAKRNEDCNVPPSGGFAKSVTEKNNRRAGEGSAYKRQESPQRFILSEGDGFYRHGGFVCSGVFL